jgi:ATP-dependent protease ClpP protease subunit
MRDNLKNQLDLWRTTRQQKAVFLVINSPGGATVLGAEMHGDLRRAVSDGTISLTTYNEGETDSAAVSVFCAGTVRWAASNATFLLHLARFLPWDTDTQELAERGALDQIAHTAQMASILAAACSRDESAMSAILHEERRRSAEEALRMHLVHAIGTCQMPQDAVVFELRCRPRE